MFEVTSGGSAREVLRPPVALAGVIHDVGGAGPIYSAVKAADGRRYLSDELRHRILVEEPNGYRWSFGTLGGGAGELRHPRGLALVPGDSAKSSRLFVCDAGNHRVQVFDGTGRAHGAFGGRGDRLGQFDLPSDVAVVRPIFDGEEDARIARDWLAVADRSNNRVQVVELDGAPVGMVNAASLWFPVRLRWADPYLEIVSVNGQSTRLNLAAALDPTLWGRKSA